MLIGLEVISVWWLSVIVLFYRFINAFSWVFGLLGPLCHANYNMGFNFANACAKFMYCYDSMA